jgi:hypothetical protein
MYTNIFNFGMSSSQRITIGIRDN